MQHVQVLPVQNTTGAAGQPIMLQSQVIQTADGQTLIYQPVQVRLKKVTKSPLLTRLKYSLQMQDGTQAMVQQPAQIAQGQQVIQLASSSLATQQQAAITTTASAAATSSATQASAQQQQQAGSGGNQNIIMMVPGATGGSPTIQRIPLPGKIEFSHEKQLFNSQSNFCSKNS